jgi:hypothetical protein
MTRPVLEILRIQKTRTGTRKKQPKLVLTGLNQSRAENSKFWCKPEIFVIINCRLTLYVNFKLLIIKIG